ncbi:MAG: NAD(P)/FAD-dependent oxidoreductase [Edaphobacter sp.]
MRLRSHTSQIDLFIAGAGPAGLACAIASALQGLTVHVADAMRPPIDKACGEGLMPDSLQALAAIGIDLNHDLLRFETHPLHGIRFLSERAATEAAFPNHPGRGIRRTILHQLLLDRAISLGVHFHWQNSVQGITPQAEGILVHTNRQTFHARYLVGADGHRSRVATWAGLTQEVIHSRRIGLRQHYTIAPWSSFVEVYWGPQGQAYVTPVSSSQVSVAFVTNKKISGPNEALAHLPALRQRLANADPTGSPRGSITLGRTLHRVATHNIALIGDASGSVDAVTGEGLALTFRQAAALAHALHANNLAAYQQAHRRIQRLPTIMSRALLLMDRHPALRNTTLGLFERHPSLFRHLLQIHIGDSPLHKTHSHPPLEPLHPLTPPHHAFTSPRPSR